MGGAWDLGAGGWLCVEDLVLTSADTGWRWELCCCDGADDDEEEEACFKFLSSGPD